MIRIAALLLLLVAGLPAADGLDQAYAAWSQGRAAEAIPALHAAAVADDRWDRWCDLGLAAAAAGDPGRAAAWLLEAHHRAPGASEPVQALTALGVELPTTWSQLLGPVAIPGTTAAGPLLLALAAACLGYAAVGRRRRPALIAGAALLVLALPGQLARQLDAGHHLVAVVAPSHLLDSTGEPITGSALPPGTVAVREHPREWSGRIAVRLSDGRRGWLPRADTIAEP